MRVLFLTKYSWTGASSRYRTYQYLPYLERAGMQCKVAQLFDDVYLANRYRRGHGSILDLLRAFLRRIRAIVKAYSFDLVIIEYELLPYFPDFLERLLVRMGLRFIVDYDDALFHQYDQHRNILVRALLTRKIAKVMRLAEMVIAGNKYLVDYAERAGAKRVEIIPTVVDINRYPLLLNSIQSSSPLVIGWIGSPATSKYLHLIVPSLVEISRNGDTEVRLIGSGQLDLNGVPVQVLMWSNDSEVEQIQTFDIGIMPLPDEPWTRGKCGFKLIQYMACGLPVVASPVGVNKEIVEHGVNGFLAETHQEWVEALFALRDNAELRKKMGQAGRRKVEEKYCLQVTAPKMIDLLKSVLEKS